jgi:hypothetical protein
VQALDESAPYVFDFEEGLREVAEALALAPGTVRSRASVADLRERDRQAKELANNTQLAQMAGQALQSGGQGAANLVAADQMQQGFTGRKAA